MYIHWVLTKKVAKKIRLYVCRHFFTRSHSFFSLISLSPFLSLPHSFYVCTFPLLFLFLERCLYQM